VVEGGWAGEEGSDTGELHQLEEMKGHYAGMQRVLEDIMGGAA